VLLRCRQTPTGQVNTALRAKALLNNVDGGFNTAIGHSALVSNANGSYNTANGYNALRLNITGSDNTAIGDGALFNNSSGGQNTAPGRKCRVQPNNRFWECIHGSGITGVAGESNACYIASIFNQTSPNGAQVLINADNKLGTSTSSKRFKNDIQPMNNASQALFSLKQIRFRYKKEIDPIGISQFGLVAEDVEQVNSDLVVHDKEGKPYSARYDQVNAMLLNEFLKEHRTVRAQQEQIDALKQELKDQRALIEKVSARIGMDSTELQLVVDKL
jgi:trimeric autotransporter adhesin